MSKSKYKGNQEKKKVLNQHRVSLSDSQGVLNEYANIMYQLHTRYARTCSHY